MVKVNIYNLAVVTGLAVVGILVLKWSAPFIPFAGARTILENV